MTHARGIVVFVIVVALLTGAPAFAGTFNSATTGNWNTDSYPSAPWGPADTWGAGIRPGAGTGGNGGTAGAGTFFPWSGDTAVIHSGHTVRACGAAMCCGWNGLGAPLPSDLSIQLNGGTLVYRDVTIDSPIAVLADSELYSYRDQAHATFGNQEHQVGNISGSGNLRLVNKGVPSRLNLKTTDNSGFNGNWDFQDNWLWLHWYDGNSNNNNTVGNELLGNASVTIDGGGMRLFGNKGLVSNPFIVDAGGATIVCGGGGGSAGLVTLGGPLSGPGALEVNISSGGVTLTNSATTVGGLLVSAGVVTLQDLGGGPADWDLSSTALTLTGGDLAYHSSVTHVTVSALSLDLTSVDNGTYDIVTDVFDGKNFSDYFNGSGTITVGAPGGAPIPEPVGLALIGLAGLTLRKRKRRP